MSKRNRERREANRRSPPPKTNPNKGVNHSAYRDKEPKENLRWKRRVPMEAVTYLIASGVGTDVENAMTFGTTDDDYHRTRHWQLGWPG